jgi:hypothetical protein
MRQAEYPLSDDLSDLKHITRDAAAKVAVPVLQSVRKALPASANVQPSEPG